MWDQEPGTCTHKSRSLHSKLHLPPKKTNNPKNDQLQKIDWTLLTCPKKSIYNLYILFISLTTRSTKKNSVFFWVPHHESDVPMWPPAPSIREAQGLDPVGCEVARGCFLPILLRFFPLPPVAVRCVILIFLQQMNR